MKLDALRLDNSARYSLIVLKRKTGIDTWNVLCRWALCVSLAEQESPRDGLVGEKKEIEIAWDVFAGKAASIYRGLLVERCKLENLEVSQKNLSYILSQHVHRGIGYLVGNKDVKDIGGLLRLAC